MRKRVRKQGPGDFFQPINNESNEDESSFEMNEITKKISNFGELVKQNPNFFLQDLQGDESNLVKMLIENAESFWLEDLVLKTTPINAVVASKGTSISDGTALLVSNIKGKPFQFANFRLKEDKLIILNTPKKEDIDFQKKSAEITEISSNSKPFFNSFEKLAYLCRFQEKLKQFLRKYNKLNKDESKEIDNSLKNGF